MASYMHSRTCILLCRRFYCTVPCYRISSWKALYKKVNTSLEWTFVIIIIVIIIIIITVIINACRIAGTWAVHGATELWVWRSARPYVAVALLVVGSQRLRSTPRTSASLQAVAYLWESYLGGSMGAPAWYAAAMAEIYS